MSTATKTILPLLMVVFFIISCDQNNPANPGEGGNNGLAHVTLSGPTRHPAIPNDTLIFTVHATNADSSNAADGTMIRWLVNGHGMWRNTTTLTQNGISTNTFVVGTGAGVDTLMIIAGNTPALLITNATLDLYSTGMYLLLTGETRHPAIPNDTIPFLAYVGNADSSIVPDSTAVNWLVNGNGMWRYPVTRTVGGFARNTYIVGSHFGIDTLMVMTGQSPNIALCKVPLDLYANVTGLFTSIYNNVLYATGHDSTLVLITVRDRTGYAVPHAVLNLSCLRGAINFQVTTDSSGVARTYLHDNASPDPDTLGDWLHVWYSASNLNDFARYYIRPPQGLRSIILNGPNQHYAYPADTIGYQAIVFLSNGTYAYDSTVVHWEVHHSPGNYGNWFNHGTWAWGMSNTGNGSAYNIFTMRSGLGIDTLVVWAQTPGLNDRVTASVPLLRTAGPITHFQWYTPAGVQVQLSVNGPAAHIWAVARDTAGNPFANPTVTWGCDLGTVVPGGIQSDTIAVGLLSAGASSGSGKLWVSTLTGVSDTIGYTVVASSPRSMTLYTDVTTMQVQGTGGINSTILHAYIRDFNGNPVTNGIPVKFKVNNGFSFMTNGTNPNQRPYFGYPGIDSSIAYTSGLGEAQIILNAGTRAGNVNLQAEVLNYFDSTGTGIIATLNSIQILDNSPASITLSGVNSEGNMEGGGLWSIWVNATLTNRNGNPVSDNTLVTFSVSPTLNAQITDTASTGNVGASGQRRSGVANTRLYYLGTHCYDTVTVRVSCQTYDSTGAPISLFDTLRFGLPLQQGSIQLNVNPTSFYFTTGRDIATHMVWAVVTDGYGQRVHGAPCLFTVQRGDVYKTSTEAANSNGIGTGTHPFGYNPALTADGTQLLAGTTNIFWPVNKRKTGNYTYPPLPALSWTDPNGNGAATVYIGGYGPHTGVGEIFLDPQTLEVTSIVTVTIEGNTNIPAQTALITYQRNG